MKITRIETIPVCVPLKPSLAIRSGRGGAHTVSPFLLVKVHTDEEIFGIGEASCTPRWSGEDQATGAHLIRAYLEPLLIGENPLEVESVTQKFRLAFAANYFTKAAVEMALWDIAGKAAGKPVYELLGGKVREFVATKWSVSGQEPAKASDIARWAVEQGFGAMKVKVGIEPDGDVARVKAVRDAIGAKVKLGVDANGGWSPEVAVPTIERLYEQRIYFAEQPVSPEDAAESAGLKCTVGSNLELGVGSAAMVHLAIATRGVAAEDFPCDIIGPFFYEDDIVREPLEIKPGSARPNGKAGLGVELDDEKVERYRNRDVR